MRKLLAIQWGLIAVVLLFTSCLDDENDVAPSSLVSITAFSIENIDYEKKTQTSSGKDTTLVLTIEGDLYPFAIDHVNGQIYNPDSLPKGTDVSKVVTSITSEGYYLVYGDDKKLYNAEDSIDFTKPVPFTVYAYDEVSSKTYYVRLNVHQSYPDSLQWQMLSESNYPGAELLEEQKALLLNGKIYVFGLQNGALVMTNTNQEDGIQWSELTPCRGLVEAIDCRSMVVFGDSFYVVANGVLYQSADGVEWSLIESDEKGIDQILVATNKAMYILQDDKILRGVGDGAWTEVQTIEKNIFPEKPVSIQTPLVTNSAIERTTLIGVPSEGERTYATVWSKLDIESQWVHYDVTGDNKQPCPALEKLAVISYDNALYAFGGKNINTALETVGAFENIYVSSDGGITWWGAEEDLGFPDALKGFEGEFSYVVDEKNYIWVMCGGSNVVYKGRINRLIKE